jgi:hypothetical protein
MGKFWYKIVSRSNTEKTYSAVSYVNFTVLTFK